MNERLTWIGDEDTGYIADAGDAVYIVDRKRPDSPHNHTAMVYRIDKKDAPILWCEGLASPCRAFLTRGPQ